MSESKRATSPSPIDAPSTSDGTRRCPACGYDLFGLGEGRCPECGAGFDEATLAVAAMIPWGRRKSIGVLPAYLRTVVLATFAPRRLGKAMEYPVRWPDARRFRWMTILLAFLPVAAAMGVWRWRLPAETMENILRGKHHLALGLLVAPISFALSVLAVLVFLYVASGIGRVFFYRRGLSERMQSRAAALSEYAVAPMAFVWAPLLVGLIAVSMKWRFGFDGVGTSVNEHYWNDWCDEYHEIAGIVAGVFVLMWLRTTLVLMRVATGAGFVKVIVAGVVLTCGWVAVALAAFVGVHLLSALIVLAVRGVFG